MFFVNARPTLSAATVGRRHNVASCMIRHGMNAPATAICDDTIWATTLDVNSGLGANLQCDLLKCWEADICGDCLSSPVVVKSGVLVAGSAAGTIGQPEPPAPGQRPFAE